MITPRIEKAILSGWATYQKINHAFGSFGGVAIPKGHTAIILDVTWNHFFNPRDNKGDTQTLIDYLKYSEYQLKIDGRKSKNYLIFKNQIDFIFTKSNYSVDLQQTVASQLDEIKKKMFFKHSAPIQKDVFFVCENYIHLTISRNEFINNIKTDYAPLNPNANEQPIPQGIKPLDVVKNATMESPSLGTVIMQRPPGQKNADPNTLGTPTQTMESYTQPYEKNLLSNLPKNSDYIYYQFPLVELGVVIFNSNDFDKIANQ